MRRSLFFVLLFASWSFVSQASIERVAPIVLPMKIQAVEISQTLTYPARVESTVSATVLADTDGVVTQILPLGSQVRKGQKILTIEQTDPVYQYAPFRVQAPVGGVVSQLDVSSGAHVTKGQKIGTVIDPSRLQVSIEIAGSDLGKFRKGLTGDMTLETGDKVSLELFGLSPVITPTTGTASAVLHFANSEDRSKVHAGWIGQVEFKLGQKKGILVPETAVVYRGTDPFVRILNKNVAKFRPVTLGARVRGQYEVLKGLVADEIIIERSSQFIADNQTVQVQEAKPEVKKGN